MVLTDYGTLCPLPDDTHYLALTFDWSRTISYNLGMRIVTQFLVLLSLLWVEGVWAVDCPQEDYELTTQAEVDAFGAESCDTVIGYLHIDGSAEEITNLNALVHLSSVGDTFWINSTGVANLDGLSSLTSVGRFYIVFNGSLTNVDGLSRLTSVGELSIGDNDALTHLDGLSSLLTVRDILQIGNNDALVNIDSLKNLTGIGGTLWITGNTVLSNLDGLSNITTVGRDLIIDISDTLTDLDGLASLTAVGGRLRIAYHSALKSTEGLANLVSVGGKLSIEDTPLINLSGLHNLATVGGRLEIAYNDAITDIDGLVNLQSVGALTVYYNRALSNCDGLAPILNWPSGPEVDDVGYIFQITANDSGCNSVREVLDSLSGPTQPVITESTTLSNSLSLGFTPSTTTDTLFPITGYSVSCTGAEVDVSGSPATDLLDNTPVQETLTVSGYDPTSVLSSIEVDINITHSDPADLYITLTTPSGTELILWNQGSSGGEGLVGTFPTTLTPENSLEIISSEPMDGEWVLRVEDVDIGPVVREGVLNSWGLRITEEVTASGIGSPIAVTGITQGREYQCRVAPVTKLGKVPESEPLIVNPSAATVFNQLLDTVLSTTRGSGKNSSVDKNGARPAQGREGENDDANAIPTLPTFALFMLSGLISLFGIRRFTQQ